MKECVAAVGTFDGFHLGHQAIVDKVIDEAGKRGLDSRVITFVNHPLSVIAPDRCPKLILTHQNTIDLIEDSGVDRVSEINFTLEMAALTAREFLKLIRERYNVRALVMGPDNSFGSDRLPSHEAYIEAGKAEGIDIQFVDPVLTAEGEKISSTAIRKAIAELDPMEVSKYLGRFYSITTKTVEGRHLGRKLGFPTMNLDVSGLQKLKPGVYAVLYHHFDDDSEDEMSTVMAGLLNVGNNPTIADDNALTYELHVVNERLDLPYGSEVEIDVLHHMRDEVKFPSLAALKKCISQDISELAYIFAQVFAKKHEQFSLGSNKLIIRGLQQEKNRLSRCLRELEKAHSSNKE